LPTLFFVILTCIHFSGLTFAFELSVRKSATIHGHLSTYLTYLGQQHDKTLQPDTLAMELDPDRLPLLVDVSDRLEEPDEPLESSPFSSLSEGCGIIDLGSYGVIQPPKGHLAIIKRDIINFLMSKTGCVDLRPDVPARDGADTGNHNEHMRDKIFQNIFQVDSPLGRACHVFYQPRPLEKGQAVELTASTRSIRCAKTQFPESTDVLRRTMIINDISQLSTLDIKAILQWTLNQSRPPFCISIAKHTNSTVLQRRFHWVAKSLLNQFDGIEKNSVMFKKSSIPDRGAVNKMVDSLLMTNAHFLEIRSAKDPTQLPSYAHLAKEISEELEASLIANGDGVSPSDPAVYCGLALALRQKCKHAASTYVILKAPESLQLQEALLNEFCEIATKATDSLLSDKAQLESLVLERLNEEGVRESVIATGSDWHIPVFRALEDVKSGDAEVNRNWYLQYQILGVVHSVAVCNQISWLHTPDPVYTYSILVAEVGKSLDPSQLGNIVKSVPPNWSLGSRFMDRSMFSGGADVSSVPASLPLFLGLVWPKLRARFGWRIDAGASRTDIAYLPPGQKNRAKRRNDQSAKIKQERQQKRAKLDRKLQEIGFGYVPKLTKRLVVQAHSEESDATKAKITVRLAFEKFSENILSNTSAPQSEAHKHRIETIVNGLCKCFEELLPVLDESVIADDGCDSLSRTYGCDQLIAMLIVLPRLLQQSGLPIRQIEDSTYMIKELVKYLTDHNNECFDPDFRPVVEEYGGSEEITDEFLASKLDSVAARDAKGGGVDGDDSQEEATMVRDLLQPGDINDLTEFTAMAMGQMAPCRAGVSDSTKKGRKHVPVGYPGLVCTHCWGMSEGKYFFTSADSLGTAGGVVYSHLARCPKFPPEEMKKITAFKGQQAEARKHLKYGAQASYFNRLWTRLHNAKTIGAPGVFVRQTSQGNVDTSMGVGRAEEEQAPFDDKKNLEFKNHIDLLDYIQRTAPWNKEADLAGAVSLYYNALCQGARIYNTNAMPSHFSSEWVLEKVSPVPLHSSKNKFGGADGLHG
jgi:hypothetical protein